MMDTEDGLDAGIEDSDLENDLEAESMN